jgi:chromosome segregation ATPase
MDKPNFLQKAAEFFGFSAERIDVMSAEEKTKLSGFGEQMTAAEGQIDQLTAQVQTATEALVRVEAESADKDITITELQGQIEAKEAQLVSLSEKLGQAEAEIAELKATIAQLPGAESTSAAAEKDPSISTEAKTEEVEDSPITKEAKALLGI